MNWRHGYTSKTRHPLYTAWWNMIRRCYDPKSSSFKNYGAKGITVCDRWRTFVLFIQDVAATWKPGMELDRISSKGNYELSNHRWADHHLQTRNKTNNRWIEFNGERKVLVDWAKSIGGNRGILGQRIRLGWSLERAITTPVRQRAGGRHV